MSADDKSDIIASLKDINAKIDALQRSQANLFRILSRKWKDWADQNRERAWL